MTTRSLSTLSHRILPLALSAACLALLAPVHVHAHAHDDQTAPAKPAAVERRPGSPTGDYVPAVAPSKEEQVKEVLASRRVTPVARMLKNVKVEVTITDQSGPGQPIVKTVNALMGDMQEASVRTFVSVPSDQPGRATQELPLNVDLSSEIARENPSLVRVRMSLQYSTGAAKAAESAKPFFWVANLTHKFDVLLENGKPLVVSESADPATDRKVTIAMKASILN